MKRSFFILSAGLVVGFFGALAGLLAIKTLFPSADLQENASLPLVALEAAVLPLAEDVVSVPDQTKNTLGLIEPIAEFKQRMTKKSFGIFITPETSPVPNDRFSGYHAGVDVEYGDRVDDVPVYAIADGTIVFRKTVPGYGGVMVIRHVINGAPHLVLYGHLDEKSFPSSAQKKVRQSDRIGVLGEAYSEETDGVRKHLHFSILKDETLTLKGYVPTKEELDAWLDPMEFYP